MSHVLCVSLSLFELTLHLSDLARYGFMRDILCLPAPPFGVAHCAHCTHTHLLTLGKVITRALSNRVVERRVCGGARGARVARARGLASRVCTGLGHYGP